MFDRASDEITPPKKQGSSAPKNRAVARYEKEINLAPGRSRLELSDFGRKIAGSPGEAPSGILQLMDDLGRAMSNPGEKLMLGGGNPAAVPAMQAVWRARMGELLAETPYFDAVLANYDIPQGRPEFIEAVASFFRGTYRWNISTENVAVTNGSQTAFFSLFNMLAGKFGRRRKKVLLPLSPEYIGYADQGLEPGLFTSCPPRIEEIDEHTFKYHIDFDRLRPDRDTGLIAVSRPTNPTGNVLTDAELAHLSALAKAHGTFLLIDNAYGAPFPDIIFTEGRPLWDEHIITSFSLSKLGLPGVRTGIVIACREVIAALAAATAIIGLANGNIGQALTAPLIKDGRLAALCREHITPFYANKARLAAQWIQEFFPAELPYRLHKAEGALFLWLWFKDLPLTSQQLYRRLAGRSVIVVPGHHFFYGIDDHGWRHRHECIRINYSQPEEIVREGLRIVAAEVAAAYRRQGR